MELMPFENPMGIDGFEFVEFAAPDPKVLHEVFHGLGFTPVAKRRRRAVTLYRQGQCNLLLNAEPDSFASAFAAAHGPSACGFALRFTRPVREVLHEVLAKDAREVPGNADTLAVDTPAIDGVGGSALYLVDRYGDRGSLYDDWEWLVPEGRRHPAGSGLTFIDHLTNNVELGKMVEWAGFYERLFNFRELHYYDIKGAKTGLVSKAMTAPDDRVRIPVNESSDPKSQINEFIEQYHGAGIQHIAIRTDDIYATVEKMRAAGVAFLDTPDAYFEMIDTRIPNHGEDIPRLARNKILIDADLESRKKILLQIFTQNCIGPIFFEIIQRKGNRGFGDGNFTALFEAMERDQMQRGVL
ncbi:MAG: 4-hydroxyphenylpyruvate dioxygenase [Rhodanobacteraceae bacterium]|nr:MAG: 4-hydroxyphenylpyruvate dioxygenase [Rhodanobacteraceae bacterium]